MRAWLRMYGRKGVIAGAAGFLLAIAPLHPVGAEETDRTEDISIALDRADIIRIPDRAAMVVVGNPLIADAVLQSGGLVVLTGKSYGATNLVVFDRQGVRLLERNLLVAGPTDVVIVYRGAARETYSCLPGCEPRVTLGDAPDFFNAALNQGVTRSNQAATVK